jgi:hypothetical protein
MLLLQNPSTLNREESWLREAYANIVSNLLEYATDPSSNIDPFASKFIGLEAVENNKEEYRAFMEVTSYFWSSKGGETSAPCRRVPTRGRFPVHTWYLLNYYFRTFVRFLFRAGRYRLPSRDACINRTNMYYTNMYILK